MKRTVEIVSDVITLINILNYNSISLIFYSLHSVIQVNSFGVITIEVWLERRMMGVPGL